MKKRLQNAYIRGSKVYIDYTLSASQAKELCKKGINAEAKRYRLCANKAATALNLKWVNENAQIVIENLLSNIKTPDFIIKEYGKKVIESSNATRKERTAKDFISILNNYIIPDFGDKEPDEIIYTEILSWQAKLTERGLSASRIIQTRTVLNQILEAAIYDGIIDKNPLAKVKAPKNKLQEPEAYSLDDVRLLLSEASGQFKNILQLLFFTGMRTGEMLALTWADIGFKNKRIRISKSQSHGVLGTTKTDEIRYIDMLDLAYEALQNQYLQTGLKNERIFTTKHGVGYKNARTMNDLFWKPLIKRTGLMELDFYNTRHTFASIMLSYGENVMWVSKMLGHANTKTTLDYYAKFINDTKIKRASFLDDFDTQVGTNLAQVEKITKMKKAV